MLIGLTIFTAGYFFFLISIDYGVMPYDEYYGIGEYDSPPCEAKYLGDGWTQLSNCAIYKIDQTKFKRIIR